MASLDSFKCRREMTVAGKTYTYFDLKEAEKNGLDGASKLPYTLKVLLENLLRFEDGRTVTKAEASTAPASRFSGDHDDEVRTCAGTISPAAIRCSIVWTSTLPLPIDVLRGRRLAFRMVSTAA